MPRYNTPEPLAASTNFLGDRANLKNVRAATENTNLKNKALMYELESALPPAEAQQQQRDIMALKQREMETKEASAKAKQLQTLINSEENGREQFQAFAKERAMLETAQSSAYHAAGGGEAGRAAADALEGPWAEKVSPVFPRFAEFFAEESALPFDIRKNQQELEAVYGAGILKRPGVQNFKTPDGIKSAQIGSAEYYDFIENGFPKQGNPTQRQQIETGAPGTFGIPGTNSQKGKDPREYAADLERGRTLMHQFGNSLSDALKKPGGFGIRGEIGDLLGGLVGQVNTDAGNVVSRTVTGMSQTELAAVRTRAKLLLAPMLPLVTHDETRYSNMDVELTTKTLKALNTASSADQVASAVKVIMGVEMNGTFRSARKYRETLPTEDAKNFPAPYGFSTDEGKDKLGARFETMGFTEDEILDMFSNIDFIYNKEIGF